jgi:hypothetical protein
MRDTLHTPVQSAQMVHLNKTLDSLWGSQTCWTTIIQWNSIFHRPYLKLEIQSVTKVININQISHALFCGTQQSLYNYIETFRSRQHIRSCAEKSFWWRSCRVFFRFSNGSLSLSYQANEHLWRTLGTSTSQNNYFISQVTRCCRNTLPIDCAWAMTANEHIYCAIVTRPNFTSQVTRRCRSTFADECWVRWR